jgi:ribosomal protein S18 acetylase RimI-like enzyme
MDLFVTRMSFTGPDLPQLRPMRWPGYVIVEGRMDASSYLDLYVRVGSSVQWDDRLRLSPAELERHLADPATRIFRLNMGGTPLGICEFADCGGPVITLANFGVVPALRGRGLGRHLLAAAVNAVWLPGTRIVLETDTNDAPGALAVYSAAGFTILDRFWKSFPD